MFGMTRGELGLTVFLFLLVYGATWVPRFGAWLGAALAGDSGGGRNARQ
jgi:hypothetical protein